MWEVKDDAVATECETAAKRVQRLLPNEQQLSAEPEDSDSEYVAPSTSNHIFTEKDVGMVTKLCMHIILCGPVSEMRINEKLSKSSAGRSLLGKFTLHQLKTVDSMCISCRTCVVLSTASNKSTKSQACALP